MNTIQVSEGIAKCKKAVIAVVALLCMIIAVRGDSSNILLPTDGSAGVAVSNSTTLALMKGVCKMQMLPLPTIRSWPVRKPHESESEWDARARDELDDHFESCPAEFTPRLRDPYREEDDRQYRKRNAFYNRFQKSWGGKRPERHLCAYKAGLETYLLIADSGKVRVSPTDRLYTFFAYDGMECRRLAAFSHFPTPEEAAAAIYARRDIRAMNNLGALHAEGVAWTKDVRKSYVEVLLSWASTSGNPTACRNLALYFARLKGHDNVQVRKWLNKAVSFEKNPIDCSDEFPIRMTSWPDCVAKAPDLKRLAESIRKTREFDSNVSTLMIPECGFNAELSLDDYVKPIDRAMASESYEDRRDALTALSLMCRRNSSAFENTKDMKPIYCKIREWLRKGFALNNCAVVRELAVAVLNVLPAEEIEALVPDLEAIVSKAQKSDAALKISYGVCPECDHGQVDAYTVECEACGGEEHRAFLRADPACSVCRGIGRLRGKVPCQRCGGKWRHCPTVEMSE